MFFVFLTDLLFITSGPNQILFQVTWMFGYLNQIHINNGWTNTFHLFSLLAQVLAVESELDDYQNPNFDELKINIKNIWLPIFRESTMALATALNGIASSQPNYSAICSAYLSALNEVTKYANN